jgi:hypothetical protein
MVNTAKLIADNGIHRKHMQTPPDKQRPIKKCPPRIVDDKLRESIKKAEIFQEVQPKVTVEELYLQNIRF